MNKPITLVLVLLFFALSFNAYACLIPLNGGSMTEMQNGCPDAQEQPTWQLCDRFKSLGIQAPPALRQLTYDSVSCLGSMPQSSNRLTSDPHQWQIHSRENALRESRSDTIVLRI